MSLIPTDWLIRRTSVEDECDIYDKFEFMTDKQKEKQKERMRILFLRFSEKMQPDDEVWWYRNPHPNGTGGFAIVRAGKVIHAHTMLIPN